MEFTRAFGSIITAAAATAASDSPATEATMDLTQAVGRILSVRAEEAEALPHIHLHHVALVLTGGQQSAALPTWPLEPTQKTMEFTRSFGSILIVKVKPPPISTGLVYPSPRSPPR